MSSTTRQSMRRWSKRAGRAFRLVSRSTGTCWPMSAGTKSKPICSKPECCSRPPPPPTNRACDAHHHEDLGDKLDEATKKSVEDAVAKVREALKGNDNDAVKGSAASFPNRQKVGADRQSTMKSTPKLSACAVPEKRPNKRRKGFCQKGVVCMKKCDYCQNLGCVVDFGTADMWGVTDETLFY